MRLLAVLSRRGRTATLGALVLAGVVVGSLSGVALATPGSGTVARPALPPRSAGRFLLAEVEQKVSGDWAKAWQSLYPLHQRIAPRDSFIRCESATEFPAPLESIHVTHVRAVPVDVAGVLLPVPGVAVRVAVELRWYGPRDPITFTHTFHLVPVQGRWTWILSRDRYRLYRHDACFGGPSI